MNILLIDKPAGPTSHDVVTLVKRHLKARKAGHAGTLDPLATGLLIIAVDAATKSLGEFSGLDKSYRATLTLGMQTDTQDAAGKIVATAGIPPWSDQQIIEICNGLIGEIELAVPSYSAVKHRGVPLYKLARRGLAVPPKIRRSRIDALWLERWEPPRITFRVDCAAGTYVRALGEEMARRLETVGHLTALRRLAIGPYRVDAATPLETFLTK